MTSGKISMIGKGSPDKIVHFNNAFSSPGKSWKDLKCCLLGKENNDNECFLLSLTFSLLDAALGCHRIAQHAQSIPITGK